MGTSSLTPETAAEQLVAAAAHDLAVRQQLVERGALGDGYQSEMRAVHEANADLLCALVAEFGWPDAARFGEAAAGAAWLIVQHAIGRPMLQRRALELMRASGAAPLHCAKLEDRIAFFEGRPQRFGTQFDWNDAGEMAPWRIADPNRVEALRSEVGLPPLAELAAAVRASAGAPPANLAARASEYAQWLVETGWRTSADSLASARHGD